MTKESHHARGLVGALILAISLFPVAAIAKDTEGSGVSLQGAASAHLEAGDEGHGSVNSTTTARLQVQAQNENDDSDAQVSEHDEHQSANSGHDLEDDEIEIDHDSAENASTTVDTPEHVTNNGELRSFLNHIIQEDDNIEDVHISSTTIETHYAMPAKFLWVIPLRLTAAVSVNNDGSVTVDYPWYAFLFATHSDIEAQLTQVSTSTLHAGSVESLSASAQAHLLNSLFSKLKGE